MTKLIRMPDGNAFSPALIERVTFYPTSLIVLCQDAKSNRIAWIKVANEVEGIRVREVLLDIADAGYRAEPPDWSFMEAKVAV